MSVLIFNRDFFQLIILAEIRATNTKLKFTPEMYLDEKRYIKRMVRKSRLFITIINLLRNHKAIETTKRL